MINSGYSESPVITAVKRLSTSALFLTATIAYTVSIVFSLISSLVGQSSIVSSLLRYADLYDLGGYGAYSYLSTIRVSSVIGTLIGMIPMILLCLGMWLTFAEGSSSGMKKMSCTGLTIIRVISIIFTVLLGLVGVISVIVCIIAMVTVGEDAIGIMLLCILVIGIVLGLYILYYLKLIQTIGTMRTVVQTETPSDRVSMYVIVMNIIIGVVNVFAALGSVILSRDFFAFLAGVATAVAYITWGVFLNSYRTEMRNPQLIPPSTPLTPPQPPKWQVDPPTGGDWSGQGILMGVCGVYGGMELKLDKGIPVIIGRNPKESNLIIATDEISRKHCSIVYNPDGKGFVLTDFNSLNGTYKGNGMKCTGTVTLQDGDTFYVGNKDNTFQVRLK